MDSESTVRLAKEASTPTAISKVDEPDAGGDGGGVGGGGDRAKHTEHIKRTKILHSFLSVPLTCCFGKGVGGKNTVQCSLDFRVDSVDDITDAASDRYRPRTEDNTSAATVADSFEDLSANAVTTTTIEQKQKNRNKRKNQKQKKKKNNIKIANHAESDGDGDGDDTAAK